MNDTDLLLDLEAIHGLEGHLEFLNMNHTKEYLFSILISDEYKNKKAERKDRAKQLREQLS